jgi:hypothetical protein
MRVPHTNGNGKQGIRPVEAANGQRTQSAIRNPQSRDLLDLTRASVLRDLQQERERSNPHRPARVRLAAAAVPFVHETSLVEGSARIRPSGWADVFTATWAEALQRRLDTAAREIAALPSDSEEARELRYRRDRLQEQLDRESQTLHRSFPPHLVVGIEWLIEDPFTADDGGGEGEDEQPDGRPYGAAFALEAAPCGGAGVEGGYAALRGGP